MTRWKEGNRGHEPHGYIYIHICILLILPIKSELPDFTKLIIICRIYSKGHKPALHGPFCCVRWMQKTNGAYPCRHFACTSVSRLKRLNSFGSLCTLYVIFVSFYTSLSALRLRINRIRLYPLTLIYSSDIYYDMHFIVFYSTE